MWKRLLTLLFILFLGSSAATHAEYCLTDEQMIALRAELDQLEISIASLTTQLENSKNELIVQKHLLADQKTELEKWKKGHRELQTELISLMNQLNETQATLNKQKEMLKQQDLELQKSEKSLLKQRNGRKLERLGWIALSIFLAVK